MADDRTPHGPGFRPDLDGPNARSEHESPTAEAVIGDVDRRMVLEAPTADVWRALTEPEELAAWWGEGSRLEPTPGGEGRFVEDGEPVRLARVVEVRPGRRLVLDWWPEDPDADEPAARVTIELTPCPFGTILTVVERALLDLSELPVLSAPGDGFLRAPWSDGPGRAPGVQSRARALALV